jgi:hypothetical protein
VSNIEALLSLLSLSDVIASARKGEATSPKLTELEGAGACVLLPELWSTVGDGVAGFCIGRFGGGSLFVPFLPNNLDLELALFLSFSFSFFLLSAIPSSRFP